MTDPGYPDPLALAAVVAYCGWDPTFRVVNQTVLLDGNGTRLLTLPSLYVTDVSAVVLSLADAATYTATLGVGSDVGWSENGTLTWQPGYSCYSGWPGGSRNVAVTFSGGYAEPPDDLMAAAQHLSDRLAGMGATSAKLGSAAVNYGKSIAEGGLLLIEQMVFDRYRIPRAA